MVLENLKTSGVQQSAKEDRITFSTLSPWPGRFIAAEGRYVEGEDGPERRAGIFIGPEFGTVQRADLVAAAKEAGEAGFDILVACAFSFSAQCTDFTQLGRIPALVLHSWWRSGRDSRCAQVMSLFRTRPWMDCLAR